MMMFGGKHLYLERWALSIDSNHNFFFFFDIIKLVKLPRIHIMLFRNGRREFKLLRVFRKLNSGDF